MNDTKSREDKPGLIVELMSLLEKCEPAIGQKRVFNRVLALVMAEIFAFGRHTVTQLLLTLGLTDEDWSAWYRIFSEKRFEEEAASAVLLKEMIAEVPEREPFVVGEDGFPVPRCSLKMPGSGWMRGLQTAKFKPGIQRGQRFVEGSWLPPMENGYSRAIPIRCLSAFTSKSVASEDGPRTEVEAALSILHWTRQQLDEVGHGEFGLRDASVRNPTYQIWTDAVLESGAAGALVWRLAGTDENGTPDPDSDGFAINCPSPVCTALGNFAAQMAGADDDFAPVADDDFTRGIQLAIAAGAFGALGREVAGLRRLAHAEELRHLLDGNHVVLAAPPKPKRSPDRRQLPGERRWRPSSPAGPASSTPCGKSGTWSAHVGTRSTVPSPNPSRTASCTTSRDRRWC